MDHALLTQHEGWVGTSISGDLPAGPETVRRVAHAVVVLRCDSLQRRRRAGGRVRSQTGLRPRDRLGGPRRGNFTRNTLTYTATFTEPGLPSVDSWSVTLTPAPGHAGCAVSGSVCSNPTTLSSSASTIVFHEPFGTYNFRVGGPSGYHPAPGSGTVKVNGAPIGQSITFSPVSYSVTFTESGLPTSTIWSVTLAGTLLSSSTSTIAFAEPNGTYGYGLGAVRVSLDPVVRFGHGHRSSNPSRCIVLGRWIHGQFCREWPSRRPIVRRDTERSCGIVDDQWRNRHPNVWRTERDVPLLDRERCGWTQSTLPPSGTITVTGAAVAEPTLEYLPLKSSVAFQKPGLPRSRLVGHPRGQSAIPVGTPRIQLFRAERNGIVLRHAGRRIPRDSALRHGHNHQGLRSPSGSRSARRRPRWDSRRAAFPPGRRSR